MNQFQLMSIINSNNRAFLQDEYYDMRTSKTEYLVHNSNLVIKRRCKLYNNKMGAGICERVNDLVSKCTVYRSFGEFVIVVITTETGTSHKN